MAWEASDITALETAIKSNVRSVQFGEKSVTYHSLAEMLQLLDQMRRSVAATTSTGGSTSCTYAKFQKG